MPRLAAFLFAATMLTGCNLAPAYQRPAPPIPANLPSGGAYPIASGQPGSSWHTLIKDDKLSQVIQRGISDSRDLRAALAEVRSARALYGEQRAAQLPVLSTSFAASYSGGPGAPITEPPRAFNATLGFSSFEIDLFGRLANLSKAAFDQYLASEAGARSTRITLISEIAAAYVTYAYDLELLHISNDTRDTAQRSLDVAEQLHGAGLSDRLDVTEAETVLHQAESDAAAATTQVAQDRNALELLVGAPVEDGLLPASLDSLDPAIDSPPAGVTSEVLLRRPDVIEAENKLKAANADIGAARAAYFPHIGLTAAGGFSSAALSSLFSAGHDSWSASPSANLPIFNPAASANVAFTKAQRDLTLAQYEAAVQQAFRETADALARAGTIDRQRQAQRQLVAASQEALQLSEQRYRAGIDTYLNTLNAQRTLDTARRSAAAAVLADLQNRLTLYRALGGSASD